MTELKKRLDENIFQQNPFNDQLKQRLIKNILISSRASKRKKRAPVIAMISAVCLILFFAIAALQAPGLFQIGASGSAIGQIQKEHPELDREIKQIPSEYKDKVQLPSKFPFIINLVKLNVEPANKAYGSPTTKAHFLFSSGQGQSWKSALVDLDFVGNGKFGFGDTQTVILDNGQTAYWTINKNASIIGWFDKKNGIVYSIALMSSSENNNPFTKRDLLEVANSMR